MQLNKLFQNPWWVVAASFCGLFIGAGTMVYVFGVFLKPVTEALNISRGTYSTGVLVFALVLALACPVLGIALDRWGSRKVLLPLIIGYAGVTATFAFLQPSELLVLTMFALNGLMGVGLSAVPFARAISIRFDQRRGLALGLAIAGAGFGVALVPQFMGLLIESAGWRTAYLVYGAAIALIAFLPIALLIGDPGAITPHTPASDLQKITTGMTAAEAFRTWKFWAMLTAFFFGIIAINGTVSHLVALLTDRGLLMPQAIKAISIVGMAAIVGRIVCGTLLDWFSGPKVALLFMVIPIVGIGLISSGAGEATPYIGAALLGFAIGGEVDLLAYFVGSYFGMRAFGKIYGTLFAVFSAGVGVGPFISGMAFDRFHSYDGVFIGYQVLLGLACLLVCTLGPYLYPPKKRANRLDAANEASAKQAY